MKGFVCCALCLALFLGGCSPEVPEEEPPAPEEASQAASSVALPSPPPKAEEPSCVEILAEQAVAVLREDGAEGERLVRALYEDLIGAVWFADPVGLDAWRYLPPHREEALPYLENRAFSPLRFKIGSCEDFAAAMVLLLRAAGFSAEYVAGYTLSVEQEYIDHAWAVVRLDGAWYHLDPQLEQNVTRENRLTYRYYLRSDDDFALDHKWGENLIAHWPDMPEREKAAIRESYTPPPCPEPYDTRPEAITTALPLPPNRDDVERAIEELRAASGLGALPPLALNVEPPILVAGRHVTPPLLPAAASPSGYGRGFLSGKAAALYDSLPGFLGRMEAGSVLELDGSLPDSEVRAVTAAFLAENPSYYWARLTPTRQGETRVLRLEMALAPEEITRRQRAIDARAEGILAPVRGGSDFEKALAIHDALAVIDYDKEETGRDSGNLYGLLLEGKAICNGYAAGFHYLAGLAGLAGVVLEGTSARGVPHAWNAVRLDGSWHYVDVTWDRPLAPEDGVYHDFFLMSAEETEEERIWNKSQYPKPPNPTESFADYYERMGYTVSGLPGEDAADRLAGVFYSQLTANPLPERARSVFLELKVSGGEEEYLAWKERFIKELFAVQSAMEALSGGGFLIDDPDSAKLNFNDTTRVLTFYPAIRTTE